MAHSLFVYTCYIYLYIYVYALQHNAIPVCQLDTFSNPPHAQTPSMSGYIHIREMAKLRFGCADGVFASGVVFAWLCEKFIGHFWKCAKVGVPPPCRAVFFPPSFGVLLISGVESVVHFHRYATHFSRNDVAFKLYTKYFNVGWCACSYRALFDRIKLYM